LRQNFAQRPLNSLDGFDDSYVLLLALATVKRNHLESIADVMVHLCDDMQTAFNERSALPFAHRKHVDQCTGDQAHQQVRKQNQIARRNTITMKTDIYKVTTQGNEN
jgi:hypothetical protein